MPRRQIQRKFLLWLEENQSRFMLKLILGKRTDRSLDFTFAGINPVIQGVLHPYGISVYIIYEGWTWDFFVDYEVSPVKTVDGYICSDCEPEHRVIFSDRMTLWIDHLFGPLLDWVNQDLSITECIALLGTPGYMTRARLINKEGKMMHGGGVSISLDSITNPTSEDRVKEQKKLLLPCRI